MRDSFKVIKFQVGDTHTISRDWHIKRLKGETLSKSSQTKDLVKIRQKKKEQKPLTQGKKRKNNRSPICQATTSIFSTFDLPSPVKVVDTSHTNKKKSELGTPQSGPHVPSYLHSMSNKASQSNLLVCACSLRTKNVSFLAIFFTFQPTFITCKG